MSVKRYSSLRVVGMRCVRSAAVQSILISSNLQRSKALQVHMRHLCMQSREREIPGTKTEQALGMGGRAASRMMIAR
jgi:hypothetical protein